MGLKPIVAYRTWRVNADGNLFSPLYSALRWPTFKPFEATCRQGGKTPCPPVGMYDDENYQCWGENRCGIYTLKKLKKVKPHPDFSVRGSVLIWGKVWEHAIGYRSQFGQVHELYVSGDGEYLDEWIYKASRRYGVPLLKWPRTGPMKYIHNVPKLVEGG